MAKINDVRRDIMSGILAQGELRRICARKGSDADAVIALLSQDH